MRENVIERYLVRRAKQLGGKAYKWVSPGNDGVPDRIVIFPKNVICFAETKSTTGRLRASQKIQIRKLQYLGCICFVITSKSDVDYMMDCMTPEGYRA